MKPVPNGSGVPNVPSSPAHINVGPLEVKVAAAVEVGGVALNVPAVVHKYTLLP